MDYPNCAAGRVYENKTDLVNFEWSVRCKTFSLVDHHRQISHSHMSMNIEMANSSQRLMSNIKVFYEDHDRRFRSVVEGPLKSME